MEDAVKGVEVEEVKWEIENGKYKMNPVPGTVKIIEADLILLALGFVHPVIEGLVSELELELDGRKNIKTNESCRQIFRRYLLPAIRLQVQAWL